MADQGPIDGHVGGGVLLPFPLQLVDQPDGAPPRVLASHLEDAGLDHRSDLVGAGSRPVGLLGQGLQPTLLIAFQPGIDALSAHAIGLGRLGDGEAISNDAQDGVVTLSAPCSAPHQTSRPTSSHCKQRRPVGPECSRISRYYDKDQALPCPRSAVIDLSRIRRAVCLHHRAGRHVPSPVPRARTAPGTERPYPDRACIETQSQYGLRAGV